MKNIPCSGRRIGDSVKLKSPFEEGTTGIIEGIRFDNSTIRYDVLVNDVYSIQRIFPDLLEMIPGYSNEQNYDVFEIGEIGDDPEYVIFLDGKFINNCIITGLYVYLNNKDEIRFEYNVGITHLKTIISINSKYVYHKDDPILRDLKLNNILV